MPGTPPPVANEREALRAYLHQQHDGIRNVAFGLTDEQAHARPTKSEITIAALVKHVAHTEAGWMDRARAGATGLPADTRPRAERAAEYGQDWNAEGDHIDDLVARFDEVARSTEDALLDPDFDLDAAVPVPRDAPWFPKDVDAWSVRWVLFHILEEVARHAGHGDIIREHVDGATMYELLAAAEGWPETSWLKPWRPAEQNA